MASVNLNAFGGFHHPAGVTSEVAFSLNASGVVQAWIAQAGTSEAITKVRCKWSSRTGTPPSYKVGLETVGTDGYPTGTYYGGGSPASVTITPPADTSWNLFEKEFTLDNSWTPTLPSDVFAITIRYLSGTINSSNFSAVVQSTGGGSLGNNGIPYVARHNGTSWAKVNTHAQFSWVTASSNVIGRAFQSTYLTATANTAGHRSAKYFTRSSSIGTTFTVAGVRLNGKMGASTGSCLVRIWDTSGNVKATCTFDTDWQGLNNGAVTSSTIYFDAPAILNYGEKYYVGLQVVSGTVGLTGYVLSDAAGMSCFPDGLTSGLATFDGSTWTETASIYPLCDLVVSDITVPAITPIAFFGNGSIGRF